MVDNNIPISIITVVYNREKYIECAIKSVLSQDYDNIEYIVIDGGSTDGSVDIIKKYENKISYWVSEPDEGMYFALNKGLELANGELIGIVHSDDFFYSQKVVEKVAKAHRNFQADVYHGDAVLITELEDRTSFERKLSRDHNILTTQKNSILHPTTFIKKSILKKNGYYDTQYKSASDYELMIRLAKCGCHFFHFRFCYLWNKDKQFWEGE